MLKSFNEFKASLTQEQQDYINGINDENIKNLSVDLTDPKALTEIAVYIAGYSFKMNIRLLELYHEWISEQL